MKNVNFLPLILIFICLQVAVAQQYYIPYNLKQAYTNKTRDLKGIPGNSYFQNSTNYNIKADFNPETGILKGSEKIVYFNNSNDSLYYLVIRLYHNILRKGSIRDEEISPEYITNGVELTSVLVEGIQYVDKENKNLHRSGTNLFLPLIRYLIPGDSVIVQIEWTTKMPPTHIHRFGNYGPSDWFIGYWYPQVAVYDDIDGWDVYNYTGRYEFYNDFNNYQVEINVPAGIMVWATGEFENAAEILHPDVYRKMVSSTKTTNTTHIITTDDWNNLLVFRKKGKLKYKYSTDSVNDFAFAVSDNYIWDAASAIIDSAENKYVTVNAVYPSDDKYFAAVADVGAKSIKHFTYNSMGVQYPFPKVTVFRGDGGMEYPMMVNQNGSDNQEITYVTMHEIFHAYFPFATGTNERKYAWMDEGLTTYLPMETESFLGGSYYQLPMVCKIYTDFAGIDVEVPLMIPSAQARDYSYYNQAYFRSTVAFSVLENYLGRDVFRGFIRYFFKTWWGKHPTGYDFIFALESYTNQNLYWLINPWFFGYGWPDLSIKKAILSENNLLITIENIGGMPLPVELKITRLDNSVLTKSIAIECWKDGKRETEITIENSADFESIELGNLSIPDKDPGNNIFIKK